jgi:DNA invertase Pin-like site-specific DNA recombinase
MRLIGYLRVSGLTQVHGDGPERQREKIVAFCQASENPEVDIRLEAGISGTIDGMDRPTFSEIIEELRDGDGIVVERLDRLARDLMVQEIILAECRKRGIKVFATDVGLWQDQADDGGEPSRLLIRRILGAVAQWEKSVLVMKMKAGADRKRRETGRCGGVVPYGELPGEQSTLAWMLAAWKNRECLTSIARTTNEMGFRTRSGKEWTKQRVHNAIARHTGAKL